jgi:succinylarginine dihydrolase
MIREINFDGLIGPSHNYAGLSPGNLAATRNAGMVSQPARCRAGGHRQDARQSGARPDPGHPAAAPAPIIGWLASLRRHYADAPPPGCRRQALSASAMWAANAATVSPAPIRRRPLPPDRRQSRDDAASQPRMARTLAQIAPRLRRPGLRGPRPGARAVRRRGRGQSHAALRGARCAGRRDLRLWRGRRPLPRAPAPRGERVVARRTGSIRRGRCSSSNPRKAIAAGAFHNDVVAVANGACCSRTSRPLPTRTVSTRRCARCCPRSRSSRCPPPPSAWPTPSPPICSTPSS